MQFFETQSPEQSATWYFAPSLIHQVLPGRKTSLLMNKPQVPTLQIYDFEVIPFRVSKKHEQFQHTNASVRIDVSGSGTRSDICIILCIPQHLYPGLMSRIPVTN